MILLGIFLNCMTYITYKAIWLSSFSTYFKTFFEEDKLKKVPAGFPRDFPEPELLKLKHYMVEHKLNDYILNAPDLVSRLGEIARAGYPLNKFLNYTVDEVI